MPVASPPLQSNDASSAKRHAPATERNRKPIAAMLREALPKQGLVLEIASGTGEHAVHFARQFPNIVWQPSDPDPEALSSIEAWRQEAGDANLLQPFQLDVSAEAWPLGRADAIVCINMVHISPWAAAEGLMRGAGQVLGSGGLLYLYGPYRQAGVETAPSNKAFDLSLKSRNPEWGLRYLEDVAAEAALHGLALEKVVPMPANNLSVLFRKE